MAGTSLRLPGMIHTLHPIAGEEPGPSNGQRGRGSNPRLPSPGGAECPGAHGPLPLRYLADLSFGLPGDAGGLAFPATAEFPGGSDCVEASLPAYFRPSQILVRGSPVPGVSEHDALPSGCRATGRLPRGTTSSLFPRRSVYDSTGRQLGRQALGERICRSLYRSASLASKRSVSMPAGVSSPLPKRNHCEPGSMAGAWMAVRQP